MSATFTFTAGNTRCDNMRVTIGGAEIGITQGGSEVTVETGLALLTSDQYGTTPLDARNTGDSVRLKLVFAEVAYANLKKALFGGTLRTSGGTAVGIGGKFAGAFSISDASAIILHPLDKADATLTNDINIWKTIPTGPIKIGMGGDKFTTIEVEFMALIDTSKTAGKQLIDFGLAAAT